MHPSINPDYFTGKKKNQGFSLVEALVGVAVAGLILTFLVSLSSQSIRVIQSMEASKSHRQDAREILHLISQDLQGALFPLDSSDLESYQMIKNPPFLNQNLLNRDALFWQTTSMRNPSIQMWSWWGILFDGSMIPVLRAPFCVGFM